MKKFEIREIDATLTLDLRHRVLWPDLPASAVILSEDANAVHLGVFRGETLVGMGSFFNSADGYRLRKLAVDPSLQGQGIASKLISHAVELLSRRGGKYLWCDSRVSAKELYRKNGFSVEDTIFQKQGVDYVKAVRSLF